MNAVPSPSHLPKLLLIVKEVYIRKAGLPDSSLMTLLIHIKGKGPQLPTNVTKMVKDGVNHLRVFGEFDGEYVIALAIMSLISPPDSSRLQDYVHPMSNDVESGSLLLFISVGLQRSITISRVFNLPFSRPILLDCPISGCRIRTPVKGRLCKHSQCFDYEYFMEANFMRPLWKCTLAHCNQPICNLDIRID
ncbi:E4 SUMO-protein ligase PIAL2-like protein isoform X1 [Tanacetum coccineum]